MDEKQETTFGHPGDPATATETERNAGHVLADIFDVMAACHPVFAEKSQALREELRAELN